MTVIRLHNHPLRVRDAACLGHLGVCAEELIGIPAHAIVELCVDGQNAYMVLWEIHKAVGLKLAELDAHLAATRINVDRMEIV